jgi:hypothetical protein
MRYHPPWTLELVEVVTRVDALIWWWWCDGCPPAFSSEWGWWCPKLAV